MSSMSNNPRYLTRPQAAEYLGVAVQTLAGWQSNRRYSLPIYKIGRLVRYKKEDLDSWLEGRRDAGEAEV